MLGKKPRPADQLRTQESMRIMSKWSPNAPVECPRRPMRIRYIPPRNSMFGRWMPRKLTTVSSNPWADSQRNPLYDVAKMTWGLKYSGGKPLAPQVADVYLDHRTDTTYIWSGAHWMPFGEPV